MCTVQFMFPSCINVLSPLLILRETLHTYNEDHSHSVYSLVGTQLCDTPRSFRIYIFCSFVSIMCMDGNLGEALLILPPRISRTLHWLPLLPVPALLDVGVLAWECASVPSISSTNRWRPHQAATWGKWNPPGLSWHLFAVVVCCFVRPLTDILLWNLHEGTSYFTSRAVGTYGRDDRNTCQVALTLWSNSLRIYIAIIFLASVELPLGSNRQAIVWRTFRPRIKQFWLSLIAVPIRGSKSQFWPLLTKWMDGCMLGSAINYHLHVLNLGLYVLLNYQA
jgi:hypothetical protein